MHPFIALMRTYCIDYTNSHDQSLYDRIMEPDYMLHTMGFTLAGRDEAYAPAVTQVFTEYPGLGLVVHEFVLNGDRLCMRFSEHGAAAQHDGRLTAWRGIGLYRWNGTRLVENWVEQDYLARDRQLATGVPNPLDRPHLDPWTTTHAVPEDPAVVETMRQFLLAGDLTAVGGDVVMDDSDVTGRIDQVLDIERVVIDDLFSAGPRAAFHVTLHGPYIGGLDVDPATVGRPVELHVAGVASVHDGMVCDLRAVSGKQGIALRHRIRPGRG
ncbi:MAG: ester cyclase [Acidimicrobiales bacterium]